MADEIQKHREGIDAIDRELVRLLNERAKHAQEIGRLKHSGHLKGGTAVYRPEREAQVLANAARVNPGPLPDDAIKGLFVEVMSACRALEAPIRVSYLGPAGTFSEMAVMQHFGHGVAGEPCFGTSRGCSSEVLAEYRVSAANPNLADPASGAVLLCTFDTKMQMGGGTIAALSLDDGKTWPHVRKVEGPGGYMSLCQTPNGVIYLIGSQSTAAAFNEAWLKEGGPFPAAK